LFLGAATRGCYHRAVRRSPALVRTPQRQISVTCEGYSALAVGRRPSAARAEADATVATVVTEEAAPWSRGLWGVFLPERRHRPAPRSEGQPERRRDAA
jgi:hypothetical protein